MSKTHTPRSHPIKGRGAIMASMREIVVCNHIVAMILSGVNEGAIASQRRKTGLLPVLIREVKDRGTGTNSTGRNASGKESQQQNSDYLHFLSFVANDEDWLSKLV